MQLRGRLGTEEVANRQKGETGALQRAAQAWGSSALVD